MLEVDMQNVVLSDKWCEEIQTVDDMKDCFNYYGCNNFILDDKDIEDLKSGKIINASIQDEYSITLRYIKEIKNECK